MTIEVIWASVGLAIGYLTASLFGIPKFYKIANTAQTDAIKALETQNKQLKNEVSELRKENAEMKNEIIELKVIVADFVK